MNSPIPVTLPQGLAQQVRYVPFGNPAQFEGRNITPVALVTTNGMVAAYDAAFVPAEARELGDFDIVPHTRLARLVMGHSGVDVGTVSASFATGGKIEPFQARDTAEKAIAHQLSERPELRAQAFALLDTLNKMISGQTQEEPNLDPALDESVGEYVKQSTAYTKTLDTSGPFGIFLADQFAQMAMVQSLSFLIAQEGFFGGWLSSNTAFEQAARSAFEYAQAKGIPAAAAFNEGIDFQTLQFDAAKLEARLKDHTYNENLQYWAAERSGWGQAYAENRNKGYL